MAVLFGLVFLFITIPAHLIYSAISAKQNGSAGAKQGGAVSGKGGGSDRIQWKHLWNELNGKHK